jgi:uncharacterized protein YoxC
MHKSLNQAGRMMVALLTVMALLAMSIAAFAIFLQVQERNQRLAIESQFNLTRQERDGLQAQVGTLEQAKAQLESELGRVRDDLASTKKQLAETMAQQEELSKSLQAMEGRKNEVDSLTGTIDQMTQELLGVRRDRDQLAKRVGELEQEQQDLQGRLSSTETERATLEKQLAEFKRVPTVELGKVVVSTEQDLPKGRVARPAPKVETTTVPMRSQSAERASTASGVAAQGQVVVVNREYDFVVMDIGKNQGIAIGQKFEVVRGSDVLGTVKVEKVYDDLAAAAILSDADVTAIQEGDTVRSL